jgi:hypothetical protein
MCGHGVCGECLLAGDEKAGMVCCRCGKKKRSPENSLHSSKAEASTNNPENRAAEKLNEA